MRTRNGAAYKGAYALLMKSDCQDWIKNEPINMATFFDQQLDIHHIFPKAWCDKNRNDPARRESIVNKTPSAYSTNRSIGGRSPSEYLQTVERQAGLSATELDRVIERHAIDPAHLRSADFDSFFDDRSERLLELIEEAMGKWRIREDATEGDPAQFEDEPDDLDDELVMREEQTLSEVPTNDGECSGGLGEAYQSAARDPCLRFSPTDLNAFLDVRAPDDAPARRRSRRARQALPAQPAR